MKEFKGPDPKVKERGPKKAKRTEDKKATKRAVRLRPVCVMPECDNRSTNGHHVISRGAPHFGDDVDENIVALCGSGSSGCHGLIENEDVTARRQLGEHIAYERPDTMRYVTDKLGEIPGRDWLRRRLYIL